ncbi:MAG: hypothetical protein SO206_06775 [Bacilli bacterium]|nr:hypothetical protein [Bacilli bacterium]
MIDLSDKKDWRNIMFEVSVGMSNTSRVETVEAVGDKIFTVTDNLLLVQRVMEICKLMRKGDVFSREDMTIKKIEQG